MKHLLLIVLVWSPYFGFCAGEKLKSDSLALDEASYDKERVQYVYPGIEQREKKAPESKSSSRIKNRNISPLIALLRPLALGILILLSVYLLSRLTVLKRLRPEKESSNQNLWNQIEQMEPFDAHIDDFLADAIKHQDFTAAVRLRFLVLLRLMNTLGYIQWAAHKTNLDLAEEFLHKRKDCFMEVLFPYNRIWFGKRNATEMDYQNFVSLCDKVTNE